MILDEEFYNAPRIDRRGAAGIAARPNVAGPLVRNRSRRLQLLSVGAGPGSREGIDQKIDGELGTLSDCNRLYRRATSASVSDEILVDRQTRRCAIRALAIACA